MKPSVARSLVVMASLILVCLTGHQAFAYCNTNPNTPCDECPQGSGPNHDEVGDWCMDVPGNCSFFFHDKCAKRDMTEYSQCSDPGKDTCWTCDEWTVQVDCCWFETPEPGCRFPINKLDNSDRDNECQSTTTSSVRQGLLWWIEERARPPSLGGERFTGRLPHSRELLYWA